MLNASREVVYILFMFTGIAWTNKYSCVLVFVVYSADLYADRAFLLFHQHYISTLQLLSYHDASHEPQNM